MNFCNALRIICSLSAIGVIMYSLSSCGNGNGKKVYADYHGVRYTRSHDGKLGRWEMYADTRQSSTGVSTLCYNADLVDSSGRHMIAATAYPLAGMQSNLDNDYIEYQILQAKVAGIDGFFIEWGFMPHENDELLKAMIRIAAKYDFEIGVNWCDGWLYYDWITRIFPEINDREKKTGYMAECYQYLIDNVFYSDTAPVVEGHPVFYHFGPGATVEEFGKVLAKAKLPEGAKHPVGLRRWADWGKLEDGKYIPVRESEEIDRWTELGEIPTPWIPARVRERDSIYPLWDNYAKVEDLLEFMKPFRDSVWLSSNPDFVVKSGFAMPGMDNRGCAGWGRGHFFLIPRHEGLTYDMMWNFCMESADSLDMMFIASWSDYTEGHEIEPTEENGYRELYTTLKYASEFKGICYDPLGMELPLRLFKVRKTADFLETCGIDVNRIDSHAGRIAMDISRGRYSAAVRRLDAAEKLLESLEEKIMEEQVTLSGSGRTLDLPQDLKKRLMTEAYDGSITFRYLDEGREFLFVRSSASKVPDDNFRIVGKVRTDNSGEWKQARIRIPSENVSFESDKPAFVFSGDVQVRDISLDLDIYTVK